MERNTPESVVRLEMIPIAEIAPSPYQSRRWFAVAGLQELAKSIERDGLIEPVVVRRNGVGWELIVGERRLRAVREHTKLESILARIVDVGDLQARRMGAAENLQREDLSAVEQVEAIVELVDADLIEDAQYEAMAPTSRGRVQSLLSRLRQAEQNAKRGRAPMPETEALTHKFVCQVQAIFNRLPTRIEWQSFVEHDLGLLKLDEEIQDLASANKLNKAQAMALAEVKRCDEDAYDALTEERGDDGTVLVDAEALSGPIDGGPVPLNQLSAREIRAKIEVPAPNGPTRSSAPVKPAPPLPSGKFDVLYADPPWEYDFMKVDAWAVEKTYQTMSLDDLLAMGERVKQMTVPSSVLFMWGTSPKLREALAVMAAWGFEYKTSLVWIKHRNRAGMGWWGRIGHELLLIGAREAAHPPPSCRRFASVVADPDADVESDEQFEMPSVIEAAKGNHSEKPIEMRQIIEQMFPGASRVELFARGAAPQGWTFWGNETEEPDNGGK